VETDRAAHSAHSLERLAMDAFQVLVSELLLETGASRVTLRLDAQGSDFPVVAEAVMHGARHIKGDGSVSGIGASPVAQHMIRTRQVLVQADLEHAEPPVARALIEIYGATAQMLAPIFSDRDLVGIVSVHHTLGPRSWGEADIAALRRAQERVGEEVARRLRHPLPASQELADAAVQGILDRLREALCAQRCTLRQDLLGAYAFPVGCESRAEGVGPLYGDFTVVQTGQPVIEKLLAERRQVVQDDTRSASSDPAFLTMLEHYGGMRAQVVTPIFGSAGLQAVLSVHDLTGPRSWTADETALAQAAADLIEQLLAPRPSDA
jgi:GAF domain-containing protein